MKTKFVYAMIFSALPLNACDGNWNANRNDGDDDDEDD